MSLENFECRNMSYDIKRHISTREKIDTTPCPLPPSFVVQTQQHFKLCCHFILATTILTLMKTCPISQ